MMYMQVMFCSKKGTVITRTEIVELPEIRGTNLTSEETFSCDDKAESLCRDGERVSGWKLLEEFEVNKEENKMNNKLIVKLMDFTSTFTKEVEVNEGDEVEIVVISGDWFMESPTVVDSADDRLWDYYDGRVYFKATKNNVDKVNNCKNNYDLLHLEFE